MLPPGCEPLVCRSAIDRALDIKDRVDPADRLDGDGRDDGRLLAALLELRVEIRELEEIATRMAPAQRACQRCRDPIARKSALYPA